MGEMREMLGVCDVGHYLCQVRVSELKLSYLSKCQVQSDKSEPSLTLDSRTFYLRQTMVDHKLRFFLLCRLCDGKVL